MPSRWPVIAGAAATEREKPFGPAGSRSRTDRHPGAHPIAGTARSEEVAATVVWLASDGASLVTGHVLVAGGGFTARRLAPPAVRILAVCNARTARSVTCGLLCEADEHPGELARLSPGVSDGDDATIRSLLVAQLEHRHARGQRPGDQLGDQSDADARRDAGELPDPVRDYDLGRRAEVIR